MNKILIAAVAAAFAAPAAYAAPGMMDCCKKCECCKEKKAGEPDEHGGHGEPPAPAAQPEG
jgi:hypothetical protein